ncbi:hypothetical protein BF17_11655 [Yersinia similis]|uniref:Uncharacterized protein n=1 Tax=Yersinia similis TaxID=367190 RepID=A0ABN4CTI3_9GAMM|nr:hypothetical protein BF17_11655 [Yersinia similis]
MNHKELPLAGEIFIKVYCKICTTTFSVQVFTFFSRSLLTLCAMANNIQLGDVVLMKNTTVWAID